MKENLKLRLDWASHKAAKFACENWHYSKCIPRGKLNKIGVWENGTFIGCIIFGRGATNHLGNKYGLKNTECIELVRIALKKHQTPVSKIISISLKIILKYQPGLKLIVSFADPDKGHHGGIYQATNWIYSGKSVDTKVPLINGKEIHPRVVGHLINSGKLKDRKNLKFITKPGKHRYLFPLNDLIKKDIMKLSKPYPKRATSIDIDAIGFQPIEGGENPTVALHPSES